MMKEKSWVAYLIWALLIVYAAFLITLFIISGLTHFFPLGIVGLIALVPLIILLSMYRQRKNSKEENYYSKNIHK